MGGINRICSFVLDRAVDQVLGSTDESELPIEVDSVVVHLRVGGLLREPQHLLSVAE